MAKTAELSMIIEKFPPKLTNQYKYYWLVINVVFFGLILIGCTNSVEKTELHPSPTPKSITKTTTPSPSYQPPDFENANYDLSIAKGSFYTMSSATLTDGKIDNIRIIDGVEKIVSSMYFVDSAIGLLNGKDNVPVGILAYDGGGSGVFYTLWIFEYDGDTLRGIAFATLGDRTPIHFLGFKDNKIVVVMTDRGPGYPNCCTWEPIILSFTFENGEMVLEDIERLGELAKQQ